MTKRTNCRDRHRNRFVRDDDDDDGESMLTVDVFYSNEDAMLGSD